jgi:hypothetical protein
MSDIYKLYSPGCSTLVKILPYATVSLYFLRARGHPMDQSQTEQLKDFEDIFLPDERNLYSFPRFC